jgi:hypothetical protein
MDGKTVPAVFSIYFKLYLSGLDPVMVWKLPSVFLTAIKLGGVSA